MEPELENRIKERESNFKQVVEILIEGLQLNKKLDEIDPDTPLFGTGLGLDSVDAVVIIVELESRFNIKISDTEGKLALRTINSLVDLVETKKRNDTCSRF